MLFSFERGDYVFHTKYGIGRFIGIEYMNINNTGYDFFKIEYLNSSYVYIPNYQLNILKFHSNKNVDTQIEELGKSKIFKRQPKLREEIEKTAKELMKIAALRRSKIVPAFPIPENYDEFAAGFEHELTICQKKAIADIFEDLRSTMPMDRLLCGDVGFGKTEVALRAIFLSLSAKKQALFIVPTTILAVQHFELAKKRFANFGFKIAMLSKLSKENESIKQGWLDGKINLLITTAHHQGVDHLLHQDIGLVVLDEEHHFGAKFKESVRKYGNFLQLSATPIPRTLNLALSKVKEISLLTTYPAQRRAVQIFVIQDGDDTRQIINKEEGKIFLVVPRIEDIHEVSKLLRKDSFIVLHGQLGPTELEKNLTAFKNGEKRVLLSTTIIESGFNIIDANLMIVFKAHMFGLSQLHQLKGRVGRNNQQASIYFMVPKVLKDIARERLNTIEENSHLGSGYSIAMQDLNIRGAGTAAGVKQSGQDYGYGIEMYYQMLSLAMGENEAFEFDKNVNFIDFGDAYIPTDLISDENLRISFYKKLNKIASFSDFEDLKEQLLSFCSNSKPINAFLEICCLQLLTRFLDISKIVKRGQKFEIHLRKLDEKLDFLFPVRDNKLTIELADVKRIEHLYLMK
jgi:transcription-repair coupling factor (superfamily II helicase)